MLANRHILLVVTGGIAAYKAVDLASRLRKKRAEVYVVMTKSATEFVSPLTFRSITNNPVYLEMFEEPKLWNVEHIKLAERADITIVAPATANMLAKMALGLADDFASTVLLAVRSQIYAAPAMNHAMYHNPATQKNIKTLKERGVRFIGPAAGFQACGTEGEGRMSEPQEIIQEIEQTLRWEKQFAGKKVVVTAGGTREPIDPVRYIGNHSSGRMGFAVAEAFREAGAEVTLIHTQVGIEVPQGVEAVKVTTAEEMLQEVLKRFDDCDIVVKAAAVADYRPAQFKAGKIKKKQENLTIELVPNPDILSIIGEKKTNQFVVGFAAETDNVMENAEEKLKRKNADMLVVNDVTKPGSGFGSETNTVSILFPDRSSKHLPQMNKLEVAREIVKEIAFKKGLLAKGVTKSEQ